MTPQDIFAGIEKDIQANPDRAKSQLDGTFRFDVTGDGGGTWIIDGKKAEVRQGSESADVTITVAADDLAAIKGGSMDAMQAFMLGKIQVEGDMGLAMKLQQIL